MAVSEYEFLVFVNLLYADKYMALPPQASGDDKIWGHGHGKARTSYEKLLPGGCVRGGPNGPLCKHGPLSCM